MSVIRERSKTFHYYEDEPPSKKLVSDGDVLVKQLYEKQQNKTLNLSEQLHKKKTFEKAIDYIPVTSFTAGKSSLQSFKLTSEYCQEVENLKRSGLSSEDIKLYYESKEGEESLLKNHKNWEISSLKDRLEVINNLVHKLKHEKTPEKTLASGCISRHRKDFALSVKPHSLETKLLRFALNSTQQNDLSLPHPMDNIKELETKLNKHIEETAQVNVNKIRKKARNLANKLFLTNTTNDCGKEITPKVNESNRTSKWDSREPESINSHVCVVEKKKTYTCKPQTFYTICNGEIVKVGNLNDVKKKEIDDNKPKLSIEEIKQLPKFEKYEIGNPTKTLFLKNLAHKVDENHLKLILQEENQDYVEIKLLKGKMRGQAFISFADEKIATCALNKINGKYVQNKPIIIQYARGKASEKKDNG